VRAVGRLELREGGRAEIGRVRRVLRVLSVQDLGGYLFRIVERCKRVGELLCGL